MRKKTKNKPSIFNTPPPRNVAWNGSVNTRAALYGTFLLLTVIMCVFCSSQLYWTKRFHDHGVVTSAKITGRQRIDGGKSITCYVDIDCLAGSQRVTGSIETDEDTYQSDTTGKTISAMYLSDDPSRIQLGIVTGNVLAEAIRAYVVNCTIIFLLLTCCAVGIDRMLVREYRLVRDGILIKGEVKRVEPYTTRSGGKMHKTTYGFNVDGNPYRGKDFGYGDQVGSTLDVLYLASNPRCNMPVGGIKSVTVVDD